MRSAKRSVECGTWGIDMSAEPPRAVLTSIQLMLADGDIEYSMDFDGERVT